MLTDGQAVDLLAKGLSRLDGPSVRGLDAWCAKERNARVASALHLALGQARDDVELEPTLVAHALEQLPDDMAEGFEMFKLAVQRQQASGFRDVSAATVQAALDALHVLLTSPFPSPTPSQ